MAPKVAAAKAVKKAAVKKSAPKAPAAAPAPKKAAPAAAPAPKKAAPKKVAKASSDAPAAVAATTSESCDVLIVSNKVCQAFDKRAQAVKAAVNKAKPSAKVVIDTRSAEGRNPDRGSFIVSVGSSTIVSLPGMARPFPAMKALDMDEVSAKVVAALN
jgi:hypothetical protein